jgi:oligoribonuclease NrnB/cAMP/cGMP phosphodiesterase (DHH superfamily)
MDGFGAAFALWKKFSDDAEYYPAKHGEEPPEVTDRDVYIVDFSYKRDVLKQICTDANHVTIIDHHISALHDLEDLDKEHDNLDLTFDMEHCGAVLTWMHVHDDPVPELLLDVEDRDLWKHQREGGKAVNAAIESYPFEFSTWQQWIADPDAREQLIKEGDAIQRYRRIQINQAKKRAVMGTIAGYKVPIVNCHHAIVSEVAGELSEGHPFAAGYSDHIKKRSWSLRSTPEGEDVSIVAGKFGGGGHQRASGFSTPIDKDNYVVEPE